MSYVGNTPFTAAFLTDTFSGNGSTVAFTMSVAPANTSSILVAVTGVTQDPSTYSVSGTTLTFSAAPPTGTSNISVRYLGIPASGVTTTAYRTQTEFTATAGQTTFSVPSYTVGFIDVYRNGLLLGSPDFTATNGTTVVLTNAASAGDFVETVSFYVSSVLNALPNTGGTLSGGLIVNGDLTTSGNTVLGDASTDTLNVGNGGLVKDASGNVGIGTSSPSDTIGYGRTLDIQGSIGAVVYLRDSDAPTTAYGFVSFDGNAGVNNLNIANSSSAGPIRLITNGAERVRIDSVGNMGIGATSPTAPLHISRDSETQAIFNRATTTTGASFVKFTNGGGNYYLGPDNSTGNRAFSSGGAAYGFSISTESAYPIVLGTNNTERARFSSNGDFAIGKAQASETPSTGSGFGFAAAAADPFFSIVNANASGGNANIYLSKRTTGTIVSINTNNGTSNTSVGSISTAASSTSYNTSSDYRLKHDIAPMTGALSRVATLKPVTYKWNVDNSDGEGFIAHELAEVCPQAVNGEKDAVNEDGSINPQGIDTSFLVATLTAAIQEQQVIITQLQADVAALKGSK